MDFVNLRQLTKVSKLERTLL